MPTSRQFIQVADRKTVEAIETAAPVNDESKTKDAFCTQSALRTDTVEESRCNPRSATEIREASGMDPARARPEGHIEPVLRFLETTRTGTTSLARSSQRGPNFGGEESIDAPTQSLVVVFRGVRNGPG